MDTATPFSIAKREVWEAYTRVKANQGAAGVEGQSIAEFERDWPDNLDKRWNRMASGSSCPPPVRRVDIPKGDGRTRPLGISTVADRIAQMVGKRYLEPEVDKHVHPDSSGYRPGKSAIEAVGQARERCWRDDWVLDLDIQGFFDTIDHALMMRAVRKHTDCPWVLLSRTVALSPRADARRHTGQSGEGDAARWGREPAAGESLLALYVRWVDAAEPSGHPGRTLCR